MKKYKRIFTLLLFLFFSCYSLVDPGSDHSIYYTPQIYNVISEEIHLLRIVETGYIEHLLENYIVSEDRDGEVVRIDYVKKRPVSIISLWYGKNYTFSLKSMKGRFSSLNIEYSGHKAELALYYHQYKKNFTSPFSLLGIKGVQVDSLLYDLDKQGRVQKIYTGEAGTIDIEREEKLWYLTSETKNSFSLPFYRTCQWDSRDNPVSLVFTDRQRTPVFHPEWNFSRKNYIYDQEGFLIKEEYVDDEGKPAWPVNRDFRCFTSIIGNSSFYPSSLVYNYKGKALTGAIIQYCSEDDNIPGEGSILITGEETTLYSGGQKPVYSVRNKGNIKEKRYYNNGALQRKSIVVMAQENNRKEVKFLEENNSSFVYYTYSGEGQLLSLSNSDNPGSSVHYLYDERGNLKELSYRNSENRLTEVDGVAVEMTLYNSRDFVTDYIFYDRNRLPVTGYEGFHRKSVEYNRLGRIKKMSWFDSDGNPVEQGSYASVLRESFPDSLTETYFNADHHVVKKEYSIFYPGSNGYSVDVMENEESEVMIERKFFNSLGLLTENSFFTKVSSGSLPLQERKIITYNNKNRIGSVTYFTGVDTADSEPSLVKKQLFFYDFLGRQTGVINE